MSGSDKSVWLITASVPVKYKVVFNRPISATVAKELFLQKGYEDIIDQEDQEPTFIISTE